MDVRVWTGGAPAADELRSLYGWLAAEQDFRGRVRLVESPPAPGRPGMVPEALEIAVGGGTGVAALSGVLISWIRHRTSDVVCRVTARDGTTAEVSATRVRAAGMEGAREIATELSAALNRDAGP